MGQESDQGENKGVGENKEVGNHFSTFGSLERSPPQCHLFRCTLPQAARPFAARLPAREIERGPRP
jgi:hypothetical protein